MLPWSPQLPAGVSMVVRQLLLQFEREGRPAAAVVSDWQAPRPRRDAEGNERFRFSVPLEHASAAVRLKAALSLPLRLARTAALLRRHRAAVVNFHYVNLDALGVALLKRAGLYRGRLLLSFHGTDLRAPRSAWEQRLWRWLFASADAVTACSAALAQAVQQQFGPHCGRVQVVHNGVDAQVFRPQAAGGGDAPALPPGPYVVSVGSFIPRKGHRVLLEAFARVAAERPALRLVIVGQDGAERPHLAERAQALGLAARMSCLVNLPSAAVAQVVAGATVAVQPSLAEPFGIAVIEAGACGVPVAASAVGGHAELLADVDGAPGGQLFTPGDADDCARALARLLDDPAAAAAIAARFRDQVLGRYSWQACAARYRAAAEA